MASEASTPWNPGGQKGAPDEPDRKLTIPVDTPALFYDMAGTKHLVIFNHQTYQDTKYFRIKPPERKSSIEDVKRLHKSFRERQFNVSTHYDLTHHQILDQVRRVSKMDHCSTSCLVIAILTHGEENGLVYAADRAYKLSDVINIVLNQAGLAGKPKLFLIQACRGDNVDPGHRVDVDGDAIVYIPTHSDCLVIRSSFEGHVSFRNEGGSWMVQALCDVLDEVTSPVDILYVTTLLNSRVAWKTSRSECEWLDKKKQIPETLFTLTKFLVI